MCQVGCADGTRGRRPPGTAAWSVSKSLLTWATTTRAPSRLTGEPRPDGTLAPTPASYRLRPPLPLLQLPHRRVPHAQGRASESRPKGLGRSSRLRKTRIDPPTRELGGAPGATKHGRNHQMFGAIAQIPGGGFRD